MRIQLKKDLEFGKRVIKAGRTITITNDKYKELKKKGYFDDPEKTSISEFKQQLSDAFENGVKPEKPKNDSQPKID